MRSWNSGKFLYIIAVICIAYIVLRSFPIKFHQHESSSEEPVKVTDYIQRIEDNDVVFYLKD